MTSPTSDFKIINVPRLRENYKKVLMCVDILSGLALDSVNCLYQWAMCWLQF